MTPKPQANKTIDEALNLDAETSELGKSFKLEQKRAIIQAMLDIPEMQSEWEQDIHGCPNPNGKARNELRAQIRAAIKLKGGK